MQLPEEQVPLPQLLLQPPQCFLSVEVSTHLLLQRDCPEEQMTEQTPPLHWASVAQALLHWPQLATSLLVETQLLPHRVVGFRQENPQLPLLQVATELAGAEHLPEQLPQ